jgi:hypothetical protein
MTPVNTTDSVLFVFGGAFVGTSIPSDRPAIEITAETMFDGKDSE